MRESRIRRTKTVCTYCGVGCSFDVWTKDRHILKVEPLDGPANGISTCVKGKFAWDHINSGDRLTKPLIRGVVDSLGGTERLGPDSASPTGSIRVRPPAFTFGWTKLIRRGRHH